MSLNKEKVSRIIHTLVMGVTGAMCTRLWESDTIVASRNAKMIMIFARIAIIASTTSTTCRRLDRVTSRKNYKFSQVSWSSPPKTSWKRRKYFQVVFTDVWYFSFYFNNQPSKCQYICMSWAHNLWANLLMWSCGVWWLWIENLPLFLV